MFAGTPSFFYRRLASPLHAARASVGAAWALALTAAALLLFDPLALLALLAAVLGAGFGAGVGRQLSRAMRTAAIVAIPIVLINVLVSREGLTVFVRLGDLGPFGQGDLTVEALVYGLVIALKVALLILITTLAGLTIDPDELLKGLRRLSFRSALTASLCVRMIPLLAADGLRLAEAQRTRPGGGARTGPRARVALLGAVVAGSLDRAMDVAATLELRGFAAARQTPRFGPRPRSRGARGSPSRGADQPSPPRRAYRARAWSRHDVAFACSGFAVVAIAVLGRLAGSFRFQAYPLLGMPVTAGALTLCLGLCVAILVPFVDRLGIEP
jgi:energy-coupling factor transport system permease protein